MRVAGDRVAEKRIVVGERRRIGRTVVVELGDLDEPVDDGEEGRPLMRGPGGAEDGLVELERVI